MIFLGHQNISGGASHKRLTEEFNRSSHGSSETNCRVLKTFTGIKKLLSFVQMDFRISLD